MNCFLPFPHYRHRDHASVMMLVLITFTIVSMVVGTVVFKTMNNYHTVVQAASWQEALLAAEGGADSGVRELRKSLKNAANAFTGWQVTDLDGTPVEDSQPSYGPPVANQMLVHNPGSVIRAGEGSGTLDMKVLVDAPSELVDARGRQWFRIRSTGTTYLPGGVRTGRDKRDHILRRLSFVWDRKTGQAVTRPSASRLVELIARPAGIESALVARGLIHLNEENIEIDSFDSRSVLKSTNGGYDVAKRQMNGDIATNGQIIEAGNAYIYGDVDTNSGTITGAANITGEQRTDFYQDLYPIETPNWTTIQPTPTFINTTQTMQALPGSTELNPTRYKTAFISEAGKRVLSFAPSAPGVKSYIELWVTGDITGTGQSAFVVEPGVHVKIYVGGNVNVAGDGFINAGANARAANLQILGIQPPRVGVAEPPVYESRSMSVAGNGSFVGVIYAPDHNVVLSAFGSSGHYWGAIVGKTIEMDGSSFIRYDEALAEDALVTDYKIVSWFEDNK